MYVILGANQTHSRISLPLLYTAGGKMRDKKKREKDFFL